MVATYGTGATWRPDLLGDQRRLEDAVATAAGRLGQGEAEQVGLRPARANAAARTRPPAASWARRASGAQRSARILPASSAIADCSSSRVKSIGRS